MRCPACSSKVAEVWESSGGINGGHWWVGLYSCANCGHLKIGGTERNGERTVVQWHPGCPIHGTDPVHVADCEHKNGIVYDAEWVCSACHRRFAVSGGKLVILWKPYDPVWLEPSVVDAAIDRLGGLPHD